MKIYVCNFVHHSLALHLVYMLQVRWTWSPGLTEFILSRVHFQLACFFRRVYMAIYEQLDTVDLR